MTAFRIEPLSSEHRRSAFDCGSQPLNDYWARQVGQDVRRRITTCFVAIEAATERVAGYYTLSAGGLSLAELPESIANKLPRYPTVPIVRIGRLAVDRDFQGQRLGGVLLYDALQRSVKSEIAVFAAVVDAKDEAAERFYERFGFQRLATPGSTLFLTFSDALKQLVGG